MISNLEKEITFRYLKTRKNDGFLNVITIFSFIGISLGVAVLIIVMSVMNGFRSDLVKKINGFNAHATIQSYDGKFSLNKIHDSDLKSQIDSVMLSNNGEGIIIKERLYPSESKLMYKSASGAIENINIFNVSNINTILKYLRENNFWIYGFDANTEKDFTNVKWSGKNVLLFGSEGYGIKMHTKKYTDFLVKIKINKKIESLNVSNSAAIAFYQVALKKKLDNI